MQTLWQDLRYGLRLLRTSPGFAAIAVLSLALGIGANTSIFSVVNTVLFRPLPVSEAKQLVFVFNGTRSNPYSGSSYPDYVDYRDKNDVFSGLITYSSVSLSVRSGEQTELMRGSVVSGNYFDVLGVKAALGRTFLPEEDQTPGAHPVAVVSHRLWQGRFGGQANVIGQQLAVNGQSFTIVGVAPTGFEGPEVFETNDIYVPMMMQALVRPPRGGFSGEMNPDLLTRRGSRWARILGRLKPGVSFEQAQAQMTTLARQLAQAYPNENQDTIATLFPVSKVDPRAYPQLLSVAGLLMAVAGMVLLIACANVANLLLARAAARRKEIAMRLALGATRARLMRQLLTESVLLALMGGLLGLLLAVWVTDVLKATPPPTGIFAFTLDYQLDGRVLGFTLALSLLTGIIFGLAPALQSSRPDLIPALKDESLVAGQGRRFNLRHLLVVAQVTLSLVLLIGAGLFLRSLRYAQAIDPGFDADHVLTASLNINLLRYTKLQGQQFYRQIIERMEALPGGQAASLARVVPMSGDGRTNSLLIEGQTAPDDASRGAQGGSADASQQVVSSNVVGAKYFSTMGIALLQGRDFTARDTEDAPGVVIVNEAFARRYFAGQKPLGQRLSLHGSRGPWLEIVGIARDSKYRRLSEDPTPFVYQPLEQNHETGMTLHVRTAGNPLSLVAAVRREVQSLDKNIPVTNLQPLTALISSSLFPARMAAVMLGVFGALALVLAGVGLYGVMSFSVSRRTRELGIRMALGARRNDVLGLVLSEGMKLVAIGVALGLMVAAALTQLLASFLYGISTTDAVTFASIPLVLATVALLACYIPARRAMKVDPMVALRYE